MFVLRMAWREIRASWSRLLFFFLCVAVGVAAIVAVRSVIQNVRVALVREARALVGSDLVIQSSRAWTPAVADRLRTRIESPEVVARAEVVETTTMAAGMNDQVKLVELRGLSEGFPFHGTLGLASGRTFTHDLLRDRGALVQPELLVQMGLAVGDTLRLAGESFVIRDVVTKDRVQGRGGFALGPRVYVDLSDLRATPILAFGSRATYQWHLRVSDAALEPLAQEIRREFRRDLVSARTWQATEDRLGRNLAMAEDYLSLVGFAMVVLGGIGVWSVTRVFIQQKLKSVAVLKCVGASSNTILGTYVLQVLVLAAAGGLVGVGIAALAITAIPESVVALAGLDRVSVTWSAAAQGLAVGMLVSLLFAAVPLLALRDVKPLLLLRAEAGPSARRPRLHAVGAAAAITLALTMVAVWQAGTVTAGVFVVAGLLVVAGALAGAATLLVRFVRPLTRSSRFAVRHAVVSLGRPGNQTRVILTAVGLGCFFILGVRALQTNLQAQLSLETGELAPDLVLVDIQRGQLPAVREMLQAYVRREPTLLPLLRGRLVEVEGARTTLRTAEEIREAGLGREFGLTYRDALADNERLTDGTFWSGRLDEDPAVIEVSIEENVREEQPIGVGDRLRFDIGGRLVDARVTSVRKVAWDDTQNGGFFFVFRPGPTIERAPHSVVGFLQLAGAPGARASVSAALQRAVVAGFPNVSVIDVGAVLVSVREIVDAVTLAITIVGGVTVGAGLLILVGAVAMTKFQRIYDAAIYRTLGASSQRLIAMVAIEYGMLGSLAGALGAVGALGLSWAVATQLFDIPWRPDWMTLGGGVVATGLTVAVVGLLASIDVVIRKPLGTLRGQ
jgi:putative ABC transport system permease protein